MTPWKSSPKRSTTIQETPNSQFRLFLSVTPCMPRIDSEKSAICIPSPPNYLAPLPVIPPRTSHPPPPPPPPPLNPTTSLASTYNNSPELFSPTLSVTPCVPRTRSVNCSPTPTSSLAHASNSSSKHDEASSESPVLFSPTFTHSTTVNKWPSPPPLP